MASAAVTRWCSGSANRTASLSRLRSAADTRSPSRSRSKLTPTRSVWPRDSTEGSSPTAKVCCIFCRLSTKMQHGIDGFPMDSETPDHGLQTELEEWLASGGTQSSPAGYTTAGPADREKWLKAALLRFAWM